MTPLLELVGLVKSFGGVTASDGLSLTVMPGEVHALIGPNGAGKTTAVAQIAGELRPDAGRILFDGRDITGLAVHRRALLGLGRSFQITSVLGEFSVLDNVALAVQAHAGHSFRLLADARRDRRLRDPARAVLARVGLAALAGRPAATLAHGDQRKLELAMALAGEPRLLLLDEPMAGMAAEDSDRMVDLLRSLKGTVAMLLVEHDMDVVFALADRVTVLDGGRVLASGAPAEVRGDARVIAAYLGEEAGT
ncbi:ABC transporter ATP-binding protein [Roseospira goensis]|uniref:Branched-chain amino acid transport system ATP-binding protein n=1 Tax=Roseospira goensis TaxID=391922 RepID=A0A7W6S1G2_9PROT|nr:ABC transporter ATP-binding protein [Roseospira goensis]MBB4287166.1 branched-chain amino acid transport system ATP-binding protein [Roseospira goensis]